MNAVVLLRQKVLDLAIRGKLTKREKGDEPASALLARIVAEKEKRNAKVGRARTSAVPQPIPDDEKPFELPNGWVWARLGELGIWKAGGTPSRSHSEYYRNGDIPWLKTGDLNDGFISDIPEKITKRGLESTSARVNAPGSVLMAMYGATIGKLGILAIPAATNQACCACDLLNCAEPEYLFYYLMAQRHAFIQLGGGGAQANISKEIIVNYQVPVPPVEEQRRIVARIKELLAAIDQYSAAMGEISNAANLMVGKVLDLAIRGKLTKREKGDEPTAALLARIAAERQKRNSASCRVRVRGALPPVSDDEKRFELPEGWEWCRLGEFGEIVLGKMLNRNVQTGKESEYLCTINVKWGSFDLSLKKRMRFQDDELKFYDLRKGDLLVCEGGDVGRCAVWQSDESYPFQNSLHRIRMFEVMPEYVQMYLHWLGVTGELQRMCSGVTIKHFTVSIVSRLPIPLPPLAEQKRIVERVDAILAECRKISR